MALELFGDFGFVGGEDATDNPYQDAQTCINWYPEIAAAKDAKEVVSLLGTPGLIQLVSVGPTLPALGTVWPQPSITTDLPVRGCWVLPGFTQALTVIADRCYLVTLSGASANSFPSLTLTQVGTLSTFSGPVCIRDNGVGGYAVIVDGPYGYYYNIATQAFSQITDPAFLGATSVAFIDGWWIFNEPDSQKFYTNSAAYSTTFDGSFFAYKDAASDRLMRVFENKEELWLIGERTTEPWYNAGGQYFPFQRLAGAVMQIGCKAQASVARLSVDGEEGLIWFGRSERGENIVVRTRGFTAETVSTPAVSNAIAQYPVQDDAIGYVYEENGHEFYVLTFPTADRTWTYDATMPPDLAWHQRLSYDPYAQVFHRHRSNAFMNFGGMRIVGDYQNGSLYQLTRKAYTDAGWPIRAQRRSPYVWNKSSRERVFMSSLQVEFGHGVGTASGLGSDPQAYLSISRDYGKNYGPALPASMGKIGQSLNRTMWRRLGFSRGAVAQIEVMEPVNRDIVGATLKAMG